MTKEYPEHLHLNKSPKISPKAFIAPNAVIKGDVEIGEDSGIWYNCAMRGDVNYISIGKRTNIQDGSIIHVTRRTAPTIIGNDVTVGHMVLLHGGILKDCSFVGMKACVMDGAVIEEYGMLAAGAVLTPNKTVPTGELWSGVPAKFFRKLSEEEMEHIKTSADNYVALAREYMELTNNPNYG